MTGGRANFDRRTYQRNFNAPRRYHTTIYVRPHGWYEHRWVYGEFLPAVFWTQNYWLADYYDSVWQIRRRDSFGCATVTTRY